MAIQMRRGLSREFDPSKMLPGEWAVAIDTDTSKQVIWMCFAPGATKRMGTYEDFRKQIEEATHEIKEEYLAEFGAILDRIEDLAEQTSDNTDTVIRIRDDVVNTYMPAMLEYFNNAKENAKTATAKAGEASASASAATESEAKAAKSEAASALSERNAKASENAAKKSELNTKASETAASKSETNAAVSASTATTKATETSGLTDIATQKSTEANNSAASAADSAELACNAATLAESYSVGNTGERQGENTDNAKYYKEQAERIIDRLGNVNNTADIDKPVALSSDRLSMRPTRRQLAIPTKLLAILLAVRLKRLIH